MDTLFHTKVIITSLDMQHKISKEGMKMQISLPEQIIHLVKRLIEWGVYVSLHGFTQW